MRSRPARVARDAWGFFPLTAVGTAFVAVATLAGWYQGVAHLDLIVLMAAFAVLVVTLLMAVLTAAGWLLVRGAFQAPLRTTSTTLEAETPTITGYAVQLPAWLPCLDVSWSWEADEETCAADTAVHRDGREAFEVVSVRRRGTYNGVTRRVRVRDILGLACITWRVREPLAFRVLPHRGKVEQVVPLLGFISGDDISDPYGDPWGDRVDMRQYGPGDSPRMIMWKVYARSRKLMVRVPERAIAARPRGCGYLVSDPLPTPLDEPSAGVARVLIERNLLGEGWTFAADGAGAPASRIEDALDTIAQSGSAHGRLSGFADFLKRADQEGYGYCVLFTPPRPGPWIDTLLEALRATRLRVHVMVGMDGVRLERGANDAKPSLARRLVMQPDPVDGPTPSELAETLRRVGAAATSVTLVDRRSGQMYNDPLALLGRTGGLR